ncbi:NAD-dependent epimerase/dehydratase family protein [Geomonas propionica]|uniref:NAD-dependent epimerase/dehydratase family protein n=1 Tax=Geomonas propionica TaxID=2798582 RepID=A0ABS0YWT5_9BACT|nr:NAD-dependent epimerase/dehydratase family protein [Geomonas propionica]MBJ6801935.1 NAD-dependent epimerase/dehydratase family protein [Geomonas propionica]
MTRICILGGTGFIGHHLIKQLQSPAREITVIGRNAVPTRELPAGIEYRSGDYGDRYFLRGVLREAQQVVALAHSTVPKTSFDDPVNDILTNLPSAVNLFDIASDCGIEKLVFVSSGGTIYGRNDAVPIAESSLQNPISPYGITKLTIEKYAMMFNELRGLPFLCVRPANAYGEGQIPFSGQGFVATAMASILEDREVVLFGERGTVRDYIHVSDVASGIVAALERGKVGECYNIASGVGRSNRDILDAIAPLARAMGLTPRIKVEPTRKFDVPVNVLDPAKLERATGWSPLVEFEAGMARTWEWLVQTRYRGAGDAYRAGGDAAPA